MLTKLAEVMQVPLPGTVDEHGNDVSRRFVTDTYISDIAHYEDWQIAECVVRCRRELKGYGRFPDLADILRLMPKAYSVATCSSGACELCRGSGFVFENNKAKRCPNYKLLRLPRTAIVEVPSSDGVVYRLPAATQPLALPPGETASPEELEELNRKFAQLIAKMDAKNRSRARASVTPPCASFEKHRFTIPHGATKRCEVCHYTLAALQEPEKAKP